MGKYGLSNVALSALVVRGLGTGGMGDSNGGSIIVSGGDAIFVGDVDVIARESRIVHTCFSTSKGNSILIATKGYVSNEMTRRKRVINFVDMARLRTEEFSEERVEQVNAISLEELRKILSSVIPSFSFTAKDG
jgi:hypothetical protein